VALTVLSDQKKPRVRSVHAGKFSLAHARHLPSYGKNDERWDLQR
jgi:hypothetical protein